MSNRIMVAMALLVVMLGSWYPVAAQSGATIAEVGAVSLTSLPPAPVNIRVSEGQFAIDAPPITHSHAGGWVYVVQGAHILTMGGRTETFQPGQAVWTPAGVAHTHDWSRAQPHRFVFIGIATNQPPTLPPGFRLFSLTDPLSGLGSSAYTVRLIRTGLAPGAQTDIRKVVDPELLIGLSGAATIVTGAETRILNPEQVLLLQAGSAYRMKNGSTDPVSVLIQSLTPRE